MNKNFKSVPVRVEDYEKALFLAMRLNKPISTVMGEIIQPIFQVCMNYKTLNLDYQISILSSTVTIIAHGQSVFFIGSCSDPTEIEKRLGEHEHVARVENEHVGNIKIGVKKRSRK
jgi:hypothetical protein